MKELGRRRIKALEILKTIPGIDLLDPQGAFYIWPDISKIFGKKTPQGNTISNSSEFAAALLEMEGVAVVPGVEFGAEGYVRMGYAVNEKKLVDAMGRIKKFITSLN